MEGWSAVTCMRTHHRTPSPYVLPLVYSAAPLKRTNYALEARIRDDAIADEAGLMANLRATQTAGFFISKKGHDVWYVSQAELRASSVTPPPPPSRVDQTLVPRVRSLSAPQKASRRQNLLIPQQGVFIRLYCPSIETES